MPTIRSTPQFAAGGFALISHDCKVNQNGLIEVSMSLACLDTATITARNVGVFVKGGVPPVPLPEDVKAAGPLNDTIYLADRTTRTESGICYINANYTGVQANARPTFSFNTETRSHNGYGVATINLPASVSYLTYPVSFDYTVELETVQYASLVSSPRTIAAARVQKIFKRRRGIVSQSRILAFADPFPTTVLKFSSVENGLVYVITETADVIFEDNLRT
jgi:hypothetical protein